MMRDTRVWTWLGVVIRNKMVLFILCGVGLIFLFYTLLNVFVEDSTYDTFKSPLFGEVIVLDAGHGGEDGGASSKMGTIEKDVTLSIALYVRDLLQQSGAFVLMTRETDVDLASEEADRLGKRKVEDLQNRVKFVQEQDASLFVSIHLNSIASPRWRGAQTFYHPKNVQSKHLAKNIQAELVRNLENTDRQMKASQDLYILKYSDMPGVLVEAGFLSHPQEAQLLASEDYQKQIAASIYFGILRYLEDESWAVQSEYDILKPRAILKE